MISSIFQILASVIEWLAIIYIVVVGILTAIICGIKEWLHSKKQ